jgi:hypothetical protein
MVHMMFGCIKHQAGVRNRDDATTTEGIEHFKYCMVHIHKLLQGRALAYAQALCSLCLFSRNFQNPEASWFIMHASMWVATEINLHRSVLALSPDEKSMYTDHDVEMRKRCFWSLYGLSIQVSGRLGRPMPLRMEDIDIEVPSPKPDFLPHESNLSKFRKCSFHIAIESSKLLLIGSQLYSSMYCVRRRAETYENDVARLEEELSVWRAQLSPIYANLDKVSLEDEVHALYIQLWDLEFQFLLKHPVLRYANTTDYGSSCLGECLDICNKILHNTVRLVKLRCLDSQWVSMVFYIAVLFTTLFVHNLRKDDMTEEVLCKLTEDMAGWESVFSAAGQMLGEFERNSYELVEHIH